MRDPEGRVGVGSEVPLIEKTAREAVEDAEAPPGPLEWQDFFTRSKPEGTFGEDLRALIDRYSLENSSNTPDFILAGLLTGILDLFAGAIRARDGWYGISPRPGQPWAPQEPPVPTDPIVARTQDMLASPAAKVAQLERELEDVRLRADSRTARGAPGAATPIWRVPPEPGDGWHATGPGPLVTLPRSHLATPGLPPGTLQGDPPMPITTCGA